MKKVRRAIIGSILSLISTIFFIAIALWSASENHIAIAVSIYSLVSILILVSVGGIIHLYDLLKQID